MQMKKKRLCTRVRTTIPSTATAVVPENLPCDTDAPINTAAISEVQQEQHNSGSGSSSSGSSSSSSSSSSKLCLFATAVSSAYGLI